MTHLTDDQQKQIALHLGKLLADTYVLAIKTQFCHWNVTGPHFHDLHLLFEEQYEALSGAVDEIAERIRALRQPAPGSLAAFAKLTRLQECSGNLSAQEMLTTLLHDHETLSQTTMVIFTEAQKLGDEVTADMMLARGQEHDKTAWMLRSTVQ